MVLSSEEERRKSVVRRDFQVQRCKDAEFSLCLRYKSELSSSGHFRIFYTTFFCQLKRIMYLCAGFWKKAGMMRQAKEPKL